MGVMKMIEENGCECDMKMMKNYGCRGRMNIKKNGCDMKNEENRSSTCIG
jgi:hypothetical protein